MFIKITQILKEYYIFPLQPIIIIKNINYIIIIVIRFPVKWHYNKIKYLINIIHVFRPAPLDFIRGTTKEVNILITMNNNQRAMLLHILLVIKN